MANGILPSHGFAGELTGKGVIMRLGEIHTDYWQSRRRPSWAVNRPTDTGPSIDQVVNANGGLMHRENERAAVLLCQLLRGAIRRGEGPVEWLLQIFQNPGTVINARARSSYARRWMMGLMRRRPKH